MSQGSYIIFEETSGEAFGCKDAETLLAAAARSGKQIIPIGCRNGGCGVCKIRILQGEYRTGKMSRAHVSEVEEKEGLVLACRTTPISSLTINTGRQLGDIKTVFIEN